MLWTLNDNPKSSYIYRDGVVPPYWAQAEGRGVVRLLL